jgi:hypothetical protein
VAMTFDLPTRQTTVSATAPLALSDFDQIL